MFSAHVNFEHPERYPPEISPLESNIEACKAQIGHLHLILIHSCIVTWGSLMRCSLKSCLDLCSCMHSQSLRDEQTRTVKASKFILIAWQMQMAFQSSQILVVLHAPREPRILSPARCFGRPPCHLRSCTVVCSCQARQIVSVVWRGLT